MAKRLVLASLVAGFAAIASWTHAPVVAFWAPPPNSPQLQPPAAKKANNLPQYSPKSPDETALVEETVKEGNGVVRTVVRAVDAKTLRERYLWHHQQIVEKLTVEQLAEKCNALRRESIGLSPEGDIEQMQKQLEQLKRKHQDDKGISARIQRAIEALKKQPTE